MSAGAMMRCRSCGLIWNPRTASHVCQKAGTDAQALRAELAEAKADAQRLRDELAQLRMSSSDKIRELTWDNEELTDKCNAMRAQLKKEL